MSFLNRSALSKILNAGLLSDDQNHTLNDEKYLYENSILLKVGKKGFTTTEPENKDRSMSNLDQDEVLQIDGGQFALLITNETINIPDNMMGFISLNTDYKFKGLVNVSGFHVNPGWKGKLIFTVYNAGPHSIPIQFKENAFRLWLANVDDTVDNNNISLDTKKESKQDSIDSNKIYSLDGDIYSPHVLAKKLHNFEVLSFSKWIAVIIAFLFGIVAGLASNAFIMFTEYYAGDNKLYLKEELLTEIKDEIVDEAIKQIQEHNLNDNASGSDTPDANNDSSESNDEPNEPAAPKDPPESDE